MSVREASAGGVRSGRGPDLLLPALALYVLLAVVVCGGALAAPADRLVGSGADPIQRLWFLAWLPFAALHHQDPLVTRYLDHPLRVNLMWNNATPLLGLLAWPLTAAAGPALAYDWLVAAALALSAWVAALVARRHVRHRLAAVAAGLLYGFSPYMVGEAAGGHLPLVVAASPPLLLALGDTIWVRRRTSIGLGIALGAVLAAQLLVSEEVLTTAALVGALVVVAIGVLGPRAALHPPRHVGRTLASAVVTFGLVAAWPLLVQFHGPGRLTGVPLQPPGRFVTDLANLVVPTRLQLLAPAAATRLTDHLSGGLAEAGGYLGLPLCVLMAAAAIRWWRQPWVRVLAAVTLVVALASLGPTLHVAGRSTGVPLPWRVLQGRPLLANVLPARLMLYVFLGSALLLALVVDHIQARWSGWRGRSVAVVVAAVALVPLVPRALPWSPATVPPFFRTAALDRIAPASVVAVAPIPTILDARAMLWQAVAGLRFQMPFGYVIHRQPGGASSENRLSPPLARALVAIEVGGRAAPAAAERPAVRRELRQEGVRWVVVGPMAHEAAAVRYVTALVGRSGVRVGGVEVWRLPGRMGGRGGGG